MNQSQIYNNLVLEEKITCGKIKSKAKTLLIAKINLLKDSEFINSLELSNIKIRFDNSDGKNIELVKNLLINSTIIISSESNPKASGSHLLVLPGYLGEISQKSLDELELNIFFKNFFPNGIPTNQLDLYFIIWFKKIIPEINLKASINYSSKKFILNEENTCTIELASNIPLLKEEEIEDNDSSLESKQNLTKLPLENKQNLTKYIWVQQTQTFNVLSGTKNANLIEKRCNFENICRGFWIQMDIQDYNNLIKFKMEINGIDRFIFTQEQIELFGIKKIFNDYILIYLDLEIGNLEWELPSDTKTIKQIYSNSLNCSRIDKIKFGFEFKIKYIHNDIKISSLSLNLLDITNTKLNWKYW